MNKMNFYEYDFAISYAGEEENIAECIHDSIKEKYENYTIFFASKERDILVGQDGEEFFENLFKISKQVIVILSENYKRKEWTRYEWDIIKERNKENRCIPVKIDNVRILGFSSNFIYLPFDNNCHEIAEICINKLIQFEKFAGIKRESELQKFTDEIKNSRGTVDKSVQLVYDNRKRTPLGDINFPDSNFSESYEIIFKNNLDYSRIKRLEIKIKVPDKLSKEEVCFNIKHCTASVFNTEKPDAIMLSVYCNKSTNFQGYDNVFNVARAEFAPFGDWGKAEEAFAYNIPIEKFEWKIDFEESYFDKKLKIKTSEERAFDLVKEILKNKKK